jgi:tripartite ATP-independent transporter DctP family solute receptor
MFRKATAFGIHRFFATSALLSVILVLTLTAYGPPAVQAQARPVGHPINLQVGCPHPQGGLVSNSVDKFAELVKQKTNGQVVITNMYQALGVEQQLAQSIMAGSVDMGVISGGNSGRFTDAVMIFDLPFMFKRYENLFKVLDGPVGDKVKAKYEKDLGVKFLYAINSGSGRDIHTRNKQLKVPADIKGLKIRTVSTPVDLLTFKAWGANPTPVDWSQCYSALQQGVVEGFQPEVGAVLAGKFYEVVKYTLRIDYQALFHCFFMNRKTFDALSPEHQKAFIESSKEAHALNMEEALAYLIAAEKALSEHGSIIYKPTPQEYAQWASIREEVWKEVGKELKDKVDLKLANEIYNAQ